MTRAGDIPQVELAGRAQLANVNGMFVGVLRVGIILMYVSCVVA